jgi:DNA-binding GntR family transcriptional regulator
MISESRAKGAMTDMSNGRASRTLAGRAVIEIQERILNGEFPPGMRLRLEELAEMLDLSPMPIREALHRLDSLGFVEHIPHRGTRVRALSASDLLDTYSVRIPLEMLATMRAASRFTAADAERAREVLNEYRRRDAAGDGRGAREAHAEFHFTIYRAAESPWLVRLIQPMFDNSHRYRAASLPARALAARHKEHLAILDACAANDVQRAGEAMRTHLHSTVRTVAKQLGLELDGHLALDTIEVATYLLTPIDEAVLGTQLNTAAGA